MHTRTNQYARTFYILYICTLYRQIGINTRNWVDSAQDRSYRRSLVNAVLNLLVPLAIELVSTLYLVESLLFLNLLFFFCLILTLGIYKPIPCSGRRDFEPYASTRIQFETLRWPVICRDRTWTEDKEPPGSISHGVIYIYIYIYVCVCVCVCVCVIVFVCLSILLNKQ